MFLCCEHASGGENFWKFMEVAALDDDMMGIYDDVYTTVILVWTLLKACCFAVFSHLRR
jgi:hypothetical protein